jgi:hypothetical protein
MLRSTSDVALQIEIAELIASAASRSSGASAFAYHVN